MSKSMGRNRGANLQKKPKAKKHTKVRPSNTFTTAYHMLQPTKELRVNMAELFPTEPGVGTVDNTKTYHINNIAQGSQANQRLGSSIYGAYLHIKGVISNESVAEGKAFRIMVLREINKGELNPATLNNLYLTPTGSSNQAPNGTSDDLKYIINRNVYRIFFDKRYRLAEQGQGGSTRLINEKIRIAHKWYYPYAQTTSDSNGGRLYIVVEACEVDGTPAATPIVNMDCVARFFFKDDNQVWKKANRV